MVLSMHRKSKGLQILSQNYLGFFGDIKVNQKLGCSVHDRQEAISRIVSRAVILPIGGKIQQLSILRQFLQNGGLHTKPEEVYDVVHVLPIKIHQLRLNNN